LIYYVVNEASEEFNSYYLPKAHKEAAILEESNDYSSHNGHQYEQ
jgi:hypothetical protein